MSLITIGIDAFLIGWIIGAIVWIVAYKTGRLREMYASLVEPFEAFEKWHRSWKSYKQPRQIHVGPVFKKKIDWLQDPKPDYLQRDSDV